VLGDLGRNKEAITSYNRSLQINPNLSQAWYNLGVELGRLGRYEEAVTSFDKAVQITPDHHNAWYNRGVALGLLGRHDEARISYETASQAKVRGHEAWNIRDNAIGGSEEAIASFDKTLEINSNYDEARSSQDIALRNLGRSEEKIASNNEAGDSRKNVDVVSVNKVLQTQNRRFLVSLIVGVSLTLNGILLLLLIRHLTPQQSLAPSPVGSPILSPNPIIPGVPSYANPSPRSFSPHLTEQDAQLLVSQWQAAKSKIFAPPYDRQLAFKFSTGKLRFDVTKALDWLTQNNSYYRYANQRVETTGRISVVGDRAKVDLKISEQYILYKNDTVIPNESDFANKINRYTLEVEDGVWKISDYEKQ